ncbi:hypothetical protein [Streptomyces sp. Je 1-369]|uniref:hypothetical protein n=1 Tax=Streptomyces sp. Je 1-369 TaxID=2966192 RepID=UPI002286AD5D|nr:hypothetical protein [Streptomyces sp. Je 1-369]WAM00569.1 hypothetical protein NOO62_17335 [Streptomyces sp. Je 1-369]
MQPKLIKMQTTRVRDGPDPTVITHLRPWNPHGATSAIRRTSMHSDAAGHRRSLLPSGQRTARVGRQGVFGPLIPLIPVIRSARRRAEAMEGGLPHGPPAAQWGAILGGPVSVTAVALWELHRMRTRHGVRIRT